ncbi:MAG: hypothetical protein HZR80_19510 [Candidatus Heimdallarchaeota archaeon]
MEKAREAALTLGYQFFIPMIEAKETTSTLEITVLLQNTGNAPFYYPLKLKAGIDNDYSEIVNFTTSITDISLLQNEMKNYSLNLPLDAYDNVSDISFKLTSSYVNRLVFFANGE